MLKLSSLTLFFNYIHIPFSAYTYQLALSLILWKAIAKHTLQSYRTAVRVIKKINNQNINTLAQTQLAF